jgi:hypothetical protein
MDVIYNVRSNLNFHSAKRLITDERHRLKEDIIEATECQKSWAKAGLVELPPELQYLDQIL